MSFGNKNELIGITKDKCLLFQNRDKNKTINAFEHNIFKLTKQRNQIYDIGQKGQTYKHEYKFIYVHVKMNKKNNKKAEEIVYQFQLLLVIQSIMISKYFTDNTTGLQRFDTIYYNNIKYFRQ